MPCFSIFEDNQGAAQLSQNPVSNSNSKHIDVRHHVLRELVRQGGVSVSHVVVVVVFFTLTDRASTIPSNTRGCQSGTRSAGQKRSEEHLPSSNESKEKHKHTNDKEKGTGITKYTGQRKIIERHSIERVWHSAGREPSDTLPGSQPCTQKNA